MDDLALHVQPLQKYAWRWCDGEPRDTPSPSTVDQLPIGQVNAQFGATALHCAPVHTLDECQPLDPAATFAVGEKVQAVFVSSFSEGEVTKIEAGKGRMTVKLSTGEKEVSMLDVAKNFDSYGKGFEPEKGMREGKGRKGKAGDGEGKAKGKAGGDGEGKGGKGKKGG